MANYVVIPARLQSSRLPGKLLLERTGKPLLQYTWEAARKAELVKSVLIATDSEEICITARLFGAQVVMTDEHRNGTLRVAEAAKKFGGFDPVDSLEIVANDLFINVQGDEPDINPNDIDKLIKAMKMAPMPMAAGTLVSDLDDGKIEYNEKFNYSVVKAAVSNGRCVYFSRAPIAGARRHVGVYAYWRSTLAILAEHENDKAFSYLAEHENLEQLMILELGMPMQAVECSHPVKGIDTEEDYERFCARRHADK